MLCNSCFCFEIQIILGHVSKTQHQQGHISCCFLKQQEIARYVSNWLFSPDVQPVLRMDLSDCSPSSTGHFVSRARYSGILLFHSCLCQGERFEDSGSQINKCVQVWLCTAPLNTLRRDGYHRKPQEMEWARSKSDPVKSAEEVACSLNLARGLVAVLFLYTRINNEEKEGKKRGTPPWSQLIAAGWAPCCPWIL